MRRAAVPQRVGDWIVGEPLGRGGAGTVYAARHARTGADGAIKLAHDGAGAVRDHWFRREAAHAARLRHPHVVPLLDAGDTAHGRPYLVYARVDGRTLEQEADGLDLGAIVRLGAELLDALGYAHDAGVVHCDVTPANVLLAGPTKTAMLIDFGLAKARSDSRARRMLGGAQVSGTPGYLSPEQARGAGSPGPASDLFGCGASLFRCLTGYAPYGGDTAMEVVQHTLTGAPLPLRPRDGLRAPMRLAQVVQRLLSRDPEHRYPSAARARRAWLEAAESHTPVRGAVRPMIPGTLGLQSMETILVDPIGSSRTGPRALFSTVRATPSAGLERRPSVPAHAEPAAPGREAELEAIVAALTGGGDAAVAITGPDGIGKSALLDAAQRALRDAGARVVFTRGRRSGRCASMEALATMLLDAIGAADLSPARLAAERLLDAVREAAGVAVADGARDPLVGGLLGIGPTGTTGSAAMEAFAAAEALLDPDRRPVVLAVDDADGVDDGTWEVIGALRERPGGGVGVLWAGRDRTPADDDVHVSLSVPPREALAEAWSRWTKDRVPQPEGVDLPGDLRALAAAAKIGGEADFDALGRLLEPAERALLDVAAVFGGDIPRRGLPKVAETVSAPHPVGEAALHAMLRAGCLVEVPSASARRERWLRLPSPALRRWLLDQLGEPARVHALCAQWLARECLDDSATNRARTAELALAAGLPASASHALSEAGRLELEAGRMRDAAPYLERALALAVGDAEDAIDRPRALAWLASSALAAGHPAEADERAVEGLALAEPERSVLHAQLLYTRSDAAVQRGRLEEAARHAREALRVLGEAGDPVELARAHALCGWILGYRLGRNEEGIAHGRRALEVAARIVAPAFRASLCGRLGANYLRAGDWDGQLEANTEDLRLSTTAKDARGIVRANINLGVCFTNRGELSRARTHTETALALAERSGEAGAAQVAHNNLAMIALDDGRADDVERHVRAVLEGAERTGHRRALPETRMTQARLAIARGQLDEADDALKRAEAEGDVADLEVAQRIRARLERARGDRQAALRRTTTLVAQPEHDPYERASSRLAHAAALEADGQTEAAARAREAADEVFHRLGADPALERRRWAG